MKWLLRKITNGLTSVKDFLVPFGAFGLFAIALLDSALIPLPGGPDAVMLLLSTQSPARMPLYALGATAGSVAGCVILYYISRRAGRRALDKFPEKKRARVKELVDRYDVLSVLVASLLPPPFPFKLFVITAGVFRLSLARFVVAVAIGRAFRFLLEGFLAVRYGEQAKEVLAANYPAVGLGVAALLVVIFVVRGLLRRKGKTKEDEGAAVENFQNTDARTQAEAEGSTEG
ncbi:MAG TPA: VTT domain-containing protein [Pyrinomonadaceae bacterium]|nr:VTT domain-containing protein [Pyrinomonadaceae bacterium]